MIRNPINYVIIEGPDLSGKTWLYEKIHRKTGYRWNIQDRSCLSMLIHARYYNRPEFVHLENLKKELACLNNKMILLLPKWDILSQRFSIRGDEIQDLVSLRKLYMLFSEAAEEFINYPNVIVVKSEINERIVDSIVEELISYENCSVKKIQQDIKQFACTSKSLEKIGINFSIYDDCSFKNINAASLDFKPEKDYYTSILNHITQKIENEIAGKNEYMKPQKYDSRRFINTSDTCISLSHFLIRDNYLDCKFFIRSSNVKDILYHDLNFLMHLCRKVHDNLTDKFDLKLSYSKIDITINSAHIPINIKDGSVK